MVYIIPLENWSRFSDEREAALCGNRGGGSRLSSDCGDNASTVTCRPMRAQHHIT